MRLHAAATKRTNRFTAKSLRQAILRASLRARTAVGATVAAADAAAGHRNVLARPAVGAEPIAGNSDRRHEIVDRLERERRQIELLADKLDHAPVLSAFMVDILRNVGALAFMTADIAAGDKIVLVLRAREIDEPAGIEKRRTGDTHVHFAAAVFVEPFRLAEAGAENQDGTVVFPLDDPVVGRLQFGAFDRHGREDRIG